MHGTVKVLLSIRDLLELDGLPSFVVSYKFQTTSVLSPISVTSELKLSRDRGIHIQICNIFMVRKHVLCRKRIKTVYVTFVLDSIRSSICEFCRNESLTK